MLEESDYYGEYLIIGEALCKLLKICIIGNDTVEKRNLIAMSNGSIKTGNINYGIYQIVCMYLEQGIEQTIKNHKAIVESNYREYLTK